MPLKYKKKLSKITNLVNCLGMGIRGERGPVATAPFLPTTCNRKNKVAPILWVS